MNERGELQTRAEVMDRILAVGGPYPFVVLSLEYGSEAYEFVRERFYGGRMIERSGKAWAEVRGMSNRARADGGHTESSAQIVVHFRPVER